LELVLARSEEIIGGIQPEVVIDSPIGGYALVWVKSWLHFSAGTHWYAENKGKLGLIVINEISSLADRACT
jgi:hypothetical protein